MIDLKNISLQFDAKLDSIMSYDIERSELTEEYRNELTKFRNIDTSMNERLPPYSGAKFLETGKLIHPFHYNWKNRHEAMGWVDTVLSGVAVGAVDGSQIYSDKNFEIPIAVIQTSSVFNRHTANGDYKQETGASLITPDEFETASVYSFGSEYVDARRFSMECNTIIRLMKEHEKLYVLLDGALILSHINVLNRNIREIYINAIVKLLSASRETRNTVIGFIDTTMPRDITLMMHFLFGLKKTKLSDTHLFSHLLWGERTAAFLCDRDDRRGEVSSSVLDNYGLFKNSIAFFYMRLSNGLPARVEFPAWVHEKEDIDKLADIIRAQCVIRGNYPDILMRAHDAAVIRMSEHDLYYGMFDNFCKAHGIKINQSAKHFHKTM
ncbi:MAG: DNA double-strand break repair nuclease NurA, partial [Candidatus Methanoperedens sp.]|nr:DNA double-strand break repair nuclease NurA [Candidatus Methanoperedens sp.]